LLLLLHLHWLLQVVQALDLIKLLEPELVQLAGMELHEHWEQVRVAPLLAPW
jgi:hypothetical protein